MNRSGAVPDSVRAAAVRADVARAGVADPAVDRLLALLEDGTGGFSRDRYVPGHVTGSGLVVSPALDAVALILHPKIGRWVQPGGHVEPADPTVEEAARREIREEIGIGAVDPLGLLDVDIHSFPAEAGRPAHLHFDVRYLFVAATTRLVAGDGVAEARWYPFDEAVGLDESVARPVRRILAAAPPGDRPDHWYPHRPT